MLTRMAACRRAGVPICNYGMTIAYTLGIFDRALAPFPDAMETYKRLCRDRRYVIRSTTPMCRCMRDPPATTNGYTA